MLGFFFRGADSTCDRAEPTPERKHLMKCKALVFTASTLHAPVERSVWVIAESSLKPRIPLVPQSQRQRESQTARKAADH